MKKKTLAKTFLEWLVDYDLITPPVYHGDVGDMKEDSIKVDIDLPAGYVEQEWRATFHRTLIEKIF